MTRLQAIAEELRALDTGRRALRNFGFVVGGVFAAIAVVATWWHGGEWTGWVAGIGAVGATLMVLGLAAPIALRPVYRVWMGLAIALGFVMTRVLLTLVFVLLMLPIGLVLRLIGKDLLSRRIDREADSYWIQRSNTKPTGERMERYF